MRSRKEKERKGRGDREEVILLKFVYISNFPDRIQFTWHYN